jgi:hypothetical protein
VRDIGEVEEKRIAADVKEWVDRVLRDYVRAMDIGEGAMLVIGRRRFVVRDGQLREAD